MPMPRRLNYEIREPAAPGIHSFIMVRHDLTHLAKPSPVPANLDAFDSLANALGAMELADEQALGAVESHPKFAEAMQEYMALLATLLPSCSVEELGAGSLSQEYCDTGSESNPHLDEALEILIELLRRRKERAQQFYATVRDFVQEYQNLQQDLSVAEPLLKGYNIQALSTPDYRACCTCARQPVRRL